MAAYLDWINAVQEACFFLLVIVDLWRTDTDPQPPAPSTITRPPEQYTVHNVRRGVEYYIVVHGIQRQKFLVHRMSGCYFLISGRSLHDNPSEGQGRPEFLGWAEVLPSNQIIRVEALRQRLDPDHSPS